MSSAEPPRSAGSVGLACSDWSRAHGVDPIGTAGCYRGYLLVEWPLPWPRDVGEVAELSVLRQQAVAAGLRLQALVPEDPRRLRLALYTRPGGPFRAFEGWELSLPAGSRAAPGARSLEAAAAALLAGEGQAAGAEVLVCTHGRRDRCCGSSGTALWRALAGWAGDHRARLRRTSHTGGHRFAPTAILLPEGSVWGYLDAAALRHIVRREGAPEDLLARYRGCSGLPSPAVQAVERSVLATLGWPLLDCGRTGEELGSGRVRLTVAAPGERTVWEATVSAGRTLPVPECGSPPELAEKSETEQVVSGLSRVV